MNNYPLRTYFLVLTVVFISIAFALPNIFFVTLPFQFPVPVEELRLNKPVLVTFTPGSYTTFTVPDDPCLEDSVVTATIRKKADTTEAEHER